MKKIKETFFKFCLSPCYMPLLPQNFIRSEKKENKNFSGGVRWQYLSLEVGIKVMTPNGKGIIESIIEDIHPSANVRMEDGTLKNFMHPATEIINGNLEFVWNLKNI